MPYKWEQTLQEVSVHVTVPEGKKARDLEIKIEKDHLYLKVKGGEVLVDVGRMDDYMSFIVIE